MIFTIPGEPTGKARPRVVRNNGVTRAFTPDRTVAYENLVKLEYQRAGGRMFGEAAQLRMTITAHYGLPKSVSKVKREAMLKGIIRPTKKPDADNVGKVICDALNHIAYRDDTQIVHLAVSKWYDDEPAVVVEIDEV